MRYLVTVMMATESTTHSSGFASRGAVTLGDVRATFSSTRRTFSTVRRPRGMEDQAGNQADFVTLVSLVSNIYHDFGHDLIPVQ